MYNHNVRPRLQMITALRLEWAAVLQNNISIIICSICHRSLSVCKLTEAISLTKHYVTFKKDPFLVLLQFTKRVLNLNVLNS